MLAVAIQDVYKNFGSFAALKGVSFEIGEGEFFGLLGPNGAGKTTLINLMAGLLKPSGGHITVGGFDVVAQARRSREVLGVVPQELVADPFFTVREQLVFQSGYFGVRGNDVWIDTLIERLGLVDKAQSYVRSLSGGMKRRVLIAQALVHKPPVIVLDEPTAGVDVELRQSLWAFIRELNGEGHTVILTTHYLEEAETLCDRIAMLKDGEVVALDHKDALLAAHAGIRLRICPWFDTGGRWPAERDGESVVFSLESYDQAAEVFAAATAAGVAVREAEFQRCDLEDVFLALVGR